MASITLRASFTGDYEDGIRIEAGPFANGRDDWACYAWEERGMPEIDGAFPTRTAALDVLRKGREYLESFGYRVSLQ